VPRPLHVPEEDQELLDWLMTVREAERVEFKEKKGADWDFNEAVKYCSAIANHGGGTFVFGMTDKLPRKIVGTKNLLGTHLNDTKKALARDLRTIHVDVREILAPEGRVLVFKVPARPRGEPVLYDGRAFMRNGDALEAMSPAMYREIILEALPDMSSQICPGTSIKDLDPVAIAELRRRRADARPKAAASGRPATDRRFLEDVRLMNKSGVTYAALILLGTPEAVARHLSNAEIIYEYRDKPAAIGPADRATYRAGYLAVHDAIWSRIDAHNKRTILTDRAFRPEDRAFNERVVREALLNAVTHRNYHHAGSIFVKHTPVKLVVQSPGGLPDSVTTENILEKSVPRNQLVAETLADCALVERSGQGVNLMFEWIIAEGKGHPDFAGTDDFQVVLSLPGEVRDTGFKRFIETVTEEGSLDDDTKSEDLLVLDLIRGGDPIPGTLAPRAPELRKKGLLESTGRGRATRYLLPKRYFEMRGERGAYTRRKGLTLAAEMELLHQHLVENSAAGSPISELEQVLGDRSRTYVTARMHDLKKANRAHLRGKLKQARWFPGPLAVSNGA
jgi:Predicted transcriptional regulator containing an HTH domain and an uncharacterized domain shared with the mammalian protein Schlafen